jgi:GNAT superfamily N-acetyltransferase
VTILSNFKNLKDLYQLQKKDITVAGQVLREAFYNDPAWIFVIPDDNERKKRLPFVFEYIIRYALKYGVVYAPTENLEGIAVWLPHTTVEISAWGTFRSGAFKAALKMGSKIGRKMEKLFEPIDKDRREHMKGRAYLYLQAIGILPEFQGQGCGRKLLNSMFDLADEEGLPIYLETETEKNCQMYSKYGFQALKPGFILEMDFPFWEMVREPA